MARERERTGLASISLHRRPRSARSEPPETVQRLAANRHPPTSTLGRGVAGMFESHLESHSNNPEPGTLAFSPGARLAEIKRPVACGQAHERWRAVDARGYAIERGWDGGCSDVGI